jgi:hypothetical protein
LRRLAVAAALLLVAAACTSTSTYVSQVSPQASASPTPSASPSPSPSPTPTGPLTITGLAVHNGEVGQNFASITLTAAGGVRPYSWAIGTGALPAGLTLSADGVISGQVTKDGTFKFTAAVADSGGGQASKAASIQVFKALKVTGTCTQTCVIGKGCAKCGSFGTVTGGQTQYSYKVTGGAIPAGMSRNALSLVGGFPAGSYGLTVQVTDKLGATASVQAHWSIYSPATLKSGGDCTSYQPSPSCVVRWTYSGGSPTATPKLVIDGYAQYCSPQTQLCATPSAPPPGWSVSVKGGLVTISASSTACVTSYVGTLKLALVDTAACATTSQSNIVDLNVDMEFSC